jgi:hypothetical protein
MNIELRLRHPTETQAFSHSAGESAKKVLKVFQIFYTGWRINKHKFYLEKGVKQYFWNGGGI